MPLEFPTEAIKGPVHLLSWRLPFPEQEPVERTEGSPAAEEGWGRGT